MNKDTDKDIYFTHQLLITLTLAISSSKDIDTALFTVLQKICEATSWAAGDAWFVNSETESIKLKVCYAQNKENGIEDFCRFGETLSLKKGEGLPGMAWERKNSVWVKDLKTLPVFPRKEIAQKAGIKTGIAVPVPLNYEVIAVLAFYLVEESDEQKPFVELVTAIAGQIGVLLKQKMTEDMLKESEIRFRSLLNSSPEAIFIADSGGKIVLANPAAGNMFGYEPEEFIGRQMEILMPEKYRQRHREGVKRYIETHVPHVIGQTVEVEGLRKDNSIFPIELSVGAWLHNEEDFFSAVIRDITSRKAYEEKIVQKQHELEQFAYVASHDMKEPLRMISSYSKLLIRSCEPHLDEGAKEFGIFIDDAVNRMQALIHDLLTYGKVGGEETIMQEVNTTEILDAVKDGLRIKVDETETDIIYQNLPVVLGNPSQLNQLFQNLVENAIKFRKQEATPRIEIMAVSKDNEWEFSVSDNGIGMEQRYEDRVFKIFQRLHNRNAYPGTGIGLAICKKIVENHGGRIWFRSALGEGTTFFFTLPAA